jgi:undecaprenyl-diphosphatase
MNLIQATVLGIVQGLTEFFPVSSSGHLILVRWILGWELGSTHIEKSFDAATHLGTAIAALVLLRADLWKMFTSPFVRDKDDHARIYSRLAIFVILASIPAALAGLVGESVVEEKLGSVWLVATQLAIFGLLLLLFDHLSSGRRTLDNLRARDAALIGLAQVLALSPGVSRSGITITAGRGLGLDRTAATRFSFLLLLPITAGAGIFKLISVFSDPGAGALVGPFAVGIVTSAISGYAAAKTLLLIVRTRSFVPFVVYRFALAGVVLAVWLSRA